MSPPSPQGSDDFFDRARRWSATVLFASGAAAIAGSLLDWVTIVALPPELPAGERERATPFTGIEAGDGWVTLVAGALIMLAALLLVLRGSSAYAWLSFVASVVVGAVAIAAYRGIDELFRREMDRVGEAEPSLGLVLVAAAGIAGVIASVAGAAASPARAASTGNEP